MKENCKWPFVPGDYELGSSDSPVAIVIIGRGVVNLSRDRFNIKGTLKTENIGIEKIIANIISNPRIRFLIVCGKDEFGHFPGDALINLGKNGVDERMRINGAKSAIPYLCNIPKEAVDRFMRQVEIIDLVYPKEVEEIIAYDPIYHFDEERTKELLKKIDECNNRDPGPMNVEPFIIKSLALTMEGSRIGKSLNLAADKFASHMLRLSSEKLATSASLTVVSEEFGVMLDPIDHEVFIVPSVSLAIKIRSYLTGGA